MNEDIIRMEREKFIARGFWPNEVMWACWRDAWLAASAIGREACVKVCEDYGDSCANEWDKNLGVADDLRDIAYECAEAIRNRGNK